MTGELSCCPQRLGKVEGILCDVGKSFGENSLSQGLVSIGGGHGLDVEPALGYWPCW